MEFLKWMVLRATPEFLLWRLKARHYVRFLRSLPRDAEPEFAPIDSLLGPGDTAVDVGANFGIYTKLFSDLVGAKGEVHSIEPVTHTYRVLSACTEVLNLTNVRLHSCALSDRDGEAIMTSPSFRKGGRNYYKASIADPARAAVRGGRFRVRLRRMDDLLSGAAGPIRFIKIDVEGHELFVLRGGSRLLEKWKPALLVEVARDPDDPASSGAEVFRLLAGLGYEPYLLDRGRLVRRAPGERSVNYFFLTPAHRERLPREEPRGPAPEGEGPRPPGAR